MSIICPWCIGTLYEQNKYLRTVRTCLQLSRNYLMWYNHLFVLKSCLSVSTKKQASKQDREKHSLVTSWGINQDSLVNLFWLTLTVLFSEWSIHFACLYLTLPAHNQRMRVSSFLCAFHLPDAQNCRHKRPETQLRSLTQVVGNLLLEPPLLLPASCVSRAGAWEVEPGVSPDSAKWHQVILTSSPEAHPGISLLNTSDLESHS